jgi:predicted outer membrane lipoprotein
MIPQLSNLVAQIPSVAHGLLILTVAGLLGAALGVVRPVRTGIVPRSAHVIQAQILLAIVGAIIIVVVGENLARAFAIVGAAGLVRYRARVEDVKDAGVMLVALAVGLTAGSGMFMFALVACAFVIGALWLLESLEPSARSRFDLKISTKHAARVRPDIEHALEQKGVTYDLRGSSPTELTYEVTVPFGQKIRPLTKLIRHLDGHAGTLVDWEIKKYETVHP